MKKFFRIRLLLFIAFFSSQIQAQKASRWQLTTDGGIAWNTKLNDTHMDHIEMSGFSMSAIVHYGVKDGNIQQKVQLVFPMLRTLPNDTHASLLHEFDKNGLGTILVNGKKVTEAPYQFYIKGMLAYDSKLANHIEIKHQLYPSTTKALFFDRTTIKNNSNQSIEIQLPNIDSAFISPANKGLYGAYKIRVKSTKKGSFTIKPKQSLVYALVYSGNVVAAKEAYVSADYELKKREQFIDKTFSNLVFESPDPILNRAFSFAKLRAVESIFDTRGGLMHAPGGGRYYAAIWANDQAEYANPFFPYLGNLAGNESAINSFRLFAKYINPNFKPIPSSIIAEGFDFWNGAGDRGDMAMIAYGASRFALSYGNKNTARELWPLIEWCLEYCKRKLNTDGVVSSDSDELEGRFPAGKANLNTSSLYYDALLSAADIAAELRISPVLENQYKKEAKQMKSAIEKYFGRTVSGFKTYRYYKGNDVLRAWICTPLTVGIFDRSNGTIDALFSDKLWTVDGLASAAGSTTFWDRATLYGLRGVFAAGETSKAMPFLMKYSKRRLLGEHVPYPVEAYPEGNQRHLSAESALYCRIITEGIFGIRPIGFNKFLLAPKLPEGWPSMVLRNIKAFNKTFDIEIKKENQGISVRVFNKNKLFLDTQIPKNTTITVQL